MAIIINVYQPHDDETVEVQFPGSKTRYKVKSPDALTIGDLRAITGGDIDCFYTLFPEEAHPLLDQLHPEQLNGFITAWTGSPKD